MPPVDKLQAAIDKLEALKASSQGEHWYRSIGGISAFGGDFGPAAVGLVHVRDGERSAYTPQLTSADADLIVTLYRTIGAQQAILSEAIDRAGITAEQGPSALNDPNRWVERRPYVLADAILGES